MENVHPAGVTSNSYLFEISPTDDLNNDELPLPESPLKVIARIYKADNTKIKIMLPKLCPP